MYYVYLIRSINYPNQKYIGWTEDLQRRLHDHNSGSFCHTKQYKPWKIVVFVQFLDKLKALDFEKYLKSGAGHAFAQKRLW
jgi:predicted GIY-YIG superfamily endonuclease